MKFISELLLLLSGWKENLLIIERKKEIVLFRSYVKMNKIY